jgi:hypothetical protein
MRGEQATNIVGGKMLIRRRLPGDGPNTIEAKQTELGSQPEIAVGSLRNRADFAFSKAVANLPRRVRVLTYVQRWVQSQSRLATCQQYASE